MKARGMYLGAVLLTVGTVLTACEDADEFEITGPMLEEVVSAVQSSKGDVRIVDRNEPLVFIDGTPISEWWEARGVSYTDSLGSHPDLDPRLIEKITVYKGTKAVELYGPEGRFGAILITLKDSIVKQEG